MVYVWSFWTRCTVAASLLVCVCIFRARCTFSCNIIVSIGSTGANSTFSVESVSSIWYWIVALTTDLVMKINNESCYCVDIASICKSNREFDIKLISHGVIHCQSKENRKIDLNLSTSSTRQRILIPNSGWFLD